MDKPFILSKNINTITSVNRCRLPQVRIETNQNKKEKTVMSEKLEDRVFTASPLPPVLHGVRLRDVKAPDEANASCKK
jgi:hypothetical protein